MDDLAALLSISKSCRAQHGMTTHAFALSAFACDRLAHKIVSPLSYGRGTFSCHSGGHEGAVYGCGIENPVRSRPPSGKNGLTSARSN